MKHILLAISFLATSISCTLGQADGPDILAIEKLGSLKVGIKEKDLGPILGKSPVIKGKVVEEGATGDFVSTWTCAEKGLSLHMSSGQTKKGAKTVRGFTATAKCTLATAKGIKIGSKKADVVKAYKAFESKDTNEASPPGSFVAGSVYGGIIFSFKDGKVSEIFFGAAAE